MIENFKNYMITKRLSNNTITNYIRDITLFDNYINSLNKSIIKTTQEDINSYLLHLRTLNYSAATANRTISSLKSFFKHLTRVGELISIEVKNIDFKKGVINVIGKGNKERIVPVHKEALNLIKRLVKTQTSKWLFPSPHKGKHLSSRRLNEIVKKYADKLNLQDVTPHKFRHSLATHLYAAGSDIRAIQSILGHESINSTNIYTKNNTDRDKKEYSKLFAG